MNKKPYYSILTVYNLGNMSVGEQKYIAMWLKKVSTEITNDAKRKLKNKKGAYANIARFKLMK